MPQTNKHSSWVCGCGITHHGNERLCKNCLKSRLNFI